MNNYFSPTATNTILYCRRWQETMEFYRDYLKLPITYASDWFVEFRLVGAAHLSIADEQRATVKSSGGRGITLTFQVENADKTWQDLRQRGSILTPVKEHPWGARHFYFYDPEGHRLEIWSNKAIA